MVLCMSTGRLYAMDTICQRGSVKATLWYLQQSDLWKTTKPYFINVPQSALPEGQLPSNEVSVPVENIEVQDMRPMMSSLDLDTNGFTIVSHRFETPVDAFQSYPRARKLYVPEVESWLRVFLGADTVHTTAFEVLRYPGLAVCS